jgi:hypothetical protein
MTPVETLLAKLPGAKKAGNSWSACCPAHEDRKASLSVSEGRDGRALVICHVGCTIEAIVSAVGLTVRDLMPEPNGPAPIRNGMSKAAALAFPTPEAAIAALERCHGPRSALWSYHDVHGDPAGLVVRWDQPGSGKDIRPLARHADGWRIGAMPEPRPLYGLTELPSAERVVVVEGEKAADAARAIGFTATTSAGGAQAARKGDWRPLATKKEVWILPDNDAPGRKYADTVAGILTKLTPSPRVRIIDLPGLPEGGDIVDWIDSHGDAAEPDGMRGEIEALARAVQPWRFEETDDLAYRPFPVDALPEPVRGFVASGAKAIGCDQSYLALPLLTALAAAIGTTRRLQLKRGWYVPAILWGAIVGESGTAKTPAFKVVMRPIRERQRKALERHAEATREYEADLARWDKQMTAWKRNKNAAEDPPEKPAPPACERFVVSDTTVEALAPILLTNPRGLLLARDELAGWIGSFDRYAGKGKAGADSANWLSMFNAESIIVDRKTGIPRTIHVPQAAVCVTGGIQPGILHRALGAEHRESGLAARLLLTCPPRKAKRWTEADIDPNAETELARLVDRLFDLQPTLSEDGETRPVLVRLAPDAKAAWTAYYNAHAVEQADLTGDLSAAWSKLEEYAARLALVLHFIRCAASGESLTEPAILDAASMTSAICLTMWFKHEARRIYAMLDETDADRDKRRLIEWIDRKGGTVTPREVQQRCRWLKEPGAAEAALEALVRASHGTWQEVSTTAKGGRPTRAFVLSTPSTVYETQTKPEQDEGFVDVDSVDAVEATTPASNAGSNFFGEPTGIGPYRDGF